MVVIRGGAKVMVFREGAKVMVIMGGCKDVGHLGRENMVVTR